MKSQIHEHQKKIIMTASKKIKGMLLPTAIILSVSGAFATRPQYDCTNSTQYHLAGGSYILAGTEGVNYVCSSGSGTCTYYTTDGINFLPCQVGTYCTSNCFTPGNSKR
jgi:hypothetical protein